VTEPSSSLRSRFFAIRSSRACQVPGFFFLAHGRTRRRLLVPSRTCTAIFVRFSCCREFVPRSSACRRFLCLRPWLRLSCSARGPRARIFPLGFSVARSNFLVRLFWCPSKVTVQESALDSQSARSAPCQFLPCIYLCYGLREFWPECQAFVFLSRSLALLRQQAVRFSSEFFLPSPLSSELGIRFVQPLVFCGRVGPWIGHPF
jgi:hypothetical protein